ncbi:MAG: copper chaperone PCu(A)C [Woeseiaceae bacterium]|nr:copper chaperone PCu(A)C [Woeseiaceae bacterium]
MQPARLSILGTVFVLTLLSACEGDARPPLIAADIVINESPSGQAMSAGYLTLTNTTKDDLSISRVSSPEFESVEIHESLLQDGVAKMRRVEKLLIPANSTVSLKPGEKHLMLMRRIGAAENISLNLYDDETLLLSVQASPARSNP